MFANPVIPPAVEPGHALLRTSYMATHTDEQLDRVLTIFEKVGKKLAIIPETRPSRFEAVQIARPGTFVRANQASQQWAAASAPLAESKFSIEQLMKLSSRDVANRLFEAVETITWRAANFQAGDLRRFTNTPQRLWKNRSMLPGLILEKGANLLLKNGKHPDT